MRTEMTGARGRVLNVEESPECRRLGVLGRGLAADESGLRRQALEAQQVPVLPVPEFVL